MTDQPEMKILAMIDARNGYDGLIAALRARIVELDTCINSVDDVAMLPDGYTAKLLAKIPVFTIGRVSFGPLLEALGLKLLVVEDWNPRVDKLEKRTTRRQRIDAAYQSAHRSKAGINRAKWTKLLLTSTSQTRSRIARSGALATNKKRKKKADHAAYMREWRARKRRRGLRDQFMDAAARAKSR